MRNTNRQFATFFVADMYFGIEVLQVQELIRSQEITPVPLAPVVIEGLMNLRGQLVTALDMRRRLNLPPRAPDQLPMNIVVRHGEGAVSLLADEIGDVVTPPADCYEATPETLRSENIGLIECVCKLEDRLLLILDTDVLLRPSPATHLEMRAAGGTDPDLSTATL